MSAPAPALLLNSEQVRSPHVSTASKNELSASTPSFVVRVSTPVYWLCWWAVLSLHCITLAFVACSAAGHLVLSLPEGNNSTPALRISVTLKCISGFSYAIATILHLMAIARMLVASIRARQLTMQQRLLNQRVGVGSRIFGRLWESVFGSTGFFGIQSHYFHTTFLVRELAEILLQTYQLFCLSSTVTRFWITDFAVAAVVLNCWAIPLVNAVRFRDEATRRFIHVVVDMHLDFVCAVSVPVLIMVPHALEFDWIRREFPLHLTLNDLWLTAAVADGRQVFVTSSIDYLSSLVPQYGIFSCLRLIKRFVQRCDPTIQPLSSSSIAPTSPQRSDPIQVSPKEKRRTRAVSVCLVLWGIGVVAVHVRAKYEAGIHEFSGCRLYLRPWFFTSIPCSVMYVNCAQRNIPGTNDQISAILSPLDRNILSRLAIGHCNKLTIPSSLVEFHALSAVTVYNSTLVSWPHDAPITDATHPDFVSVHFHRCRIHSFPSGFLHSNLPKSMAIFAMTSSHLIDTTIPEDIGALWADSALTTLILDDMALRSLPQSLGKLPIQELFIAGNQLEELDSETFRDLALYKLDVSGKELQRLPKTIRDTSRLQFLVAENTNVTELPEWVRSWAASKPRGLDLRIGSFQGSPVCEPNQEATRYPRRLCGVSQHPLDLYELVRNQYAV